jgi:hypothetical protein
VFFLRLATTSLSDTLLDVYDPNYLDDPELRAGKHKTAMMLPGYIVRENIRCEDERTPPITTI